MKKSDEIKFKEAKSAVLEKVMPYFTDPSAYPMQKLSLEECAILLSPDAEHVMSRTAMCKCEHTALQKMKRGLAKLGITSVSDIL
jgi:hypothetical protein